MAEGATVGHCLVGSCSDPCLIRRLQTDPRRELSTANRQCAPEPSSLLASLLVPARSFPVAGRKPPLSIKTAEGCSETSKVTVLNAHKILPVKSLGFSLILLNAHSDYAGLADKPDISYHRLFKLGKVAHIATGLLASLILPEWESYSLIYLSPC